MGVYLNSKNPFGLFLDEFASTYFVDKSEILNELLPLVSQHEKMVWQEEANKGKSNKYVCITRPRRFGKTLMASMIASFFGKGRDSRKVFQQLKIGTSENFEAHINQHNVIYISFNEIPDECTTYSQYISRIKRILRTDLKKAFPDAEIEKGDAVWDALNRIYEMEDDVRFIFVLDEWDYIFHRDFVTDRDKAAFMEFLSNMLKGKAYVEFAYMTGILPIAKYSSGSELNMFCEYTMVTEEKYSEYFGFTDREVDDLFARYQRQGLQTEYVTREGLKVWYDGYHTKSGERVYNPRSVVFSLMNNNLGNYWTSSGPYDEIFYYVRENTDTVRDELALMVSGVPVPAKVREYAATSMELKTKDEIFSAMVVYGFLNYEDGCVSIPNRELMEKFADMLRKEPSLGYVYRLARESERMLRATKAGDAATVADILKYAHDTESPLLNYSSETELTMLVNMAYLSARDTYQVEREDKAGIGYVDFIFYPVKREDDCIILELKVDCTADEAIQQIKERNYALKFQGRLGEKMKFTGRILAVGIAYHKKDKKHSCRIEVLRERL
ncbi:MAG: AAA family ATPase [Lachnospiraceae bacterium]|nr:AAA family ATPase [Lachnospiraceae bacterium]